MKRTLLLVLAIVAISFASATAQTATGTLSVKATVTGSINLAFASDASGLALSSISNTPTPATATLDFGNISAFGTVPGTVARTVGTNNFTVSTPVDVIVTAYNSASSNYTLAAQLGAADNTNGWAVAGKTLSNTASQSLTNAGTYAANAPEVVALTVPFTEATGQVSNSIIFTATAN